MRSTSSRVLLLALVVSACKSQPTPPTPASATTSQTSGPDARLPEPERTLSSTLTLVKTTAELPDSCKAAFMRLAHMSKFEMAEPGEKFEATDVVSGNLPRRRLMLGAYSQTRCLISYEKGGWGLSRKVVFFAVMPDQKTEFIGGTYLDRAASFEDMRAALLKRKMPILSLSEGSW